MIEARHLPPIRISLIPNSFVSRLVMIVVLLGPVAMRSLAASGDVVAWGAGSFRDRARPITIDSAYLGQAKVPATASNHVVAISAGAFHSAALLSDGSVVAWGAGDSPRDRFNDNTKDYGQSIVPIEAQSGVIAIAAGGYHTLALKNDGSVVAWGAGSVQWSTFADYGQSKVPPEAASGIVAIAAGENHSLALTTGGKVIGWGYLGSVVATNAKSDVISIAAGVNHSVALKSDGSVVAWGGNESGQATVPSAARSGVKAIAAGGFHTLALKIDGSVIAWGSNTYGQRSVPVSARSGVAAIAAAYYHSVALKSNGVVVVWGSNVYGQTNTPPKIQGSVMAISSGGQHTLALVSAPVTINISPEGSSLKVSWPASSIGFIPEYSPSLAPTDWQPVVGPVDTSNGTNTITVPGDGSAGFFRLFKL